jgi:antitoxin component YwqK of YwqJK toxin-antitoxin module
MTEIKREYYTNDDNEIIGLESEWEEINGRKHGYYKQYYLDGTLAEYRIYKDDKIYCDCKEFNYKGQIVSICVYYDNKYPNGYKECEFYGIKMENLIKNKQILNE